MILHVILVAMWGITVAVANALGKQPKYRKYTHSISRVSIYGVGAVPFTVPS